MNPTIMHTIQTEEVGDSWNRSNTFTSALVELPLSIHSELNQLLLEEISSVTIGFEVGTSARSMSSSWNSNGRLHVG